MRRRCIYKGITVIEIEGFYQIISADSTIVVCLVQTYIFLGLTTEVGHMSASLVSTYTKIWMSASLCIYEFPA